MAKLSDLVRTVADLTGVPLSSVTVVGRVLREAGFVASKGRGRGGADMGSRDTAHLLLGVITLGDTTKAAEIVAGLQAALAQGARARIGNASQYFSGDETYYYFPRISNGSVVDTLEDTLSQLRPRNKLGSINSLVEYDISRDGEPNWRVCVDGQTPHSLAIKASNMGSWQITLAIAFENSSAIDLDFSIGAPVAHLPGSKPHMLRMNVMHAPIIEGVVRCIRDEPPRQWREDEG
ncbi:MAG: hypothetical protein Q8M38_08840 [Phenylobacterium sp.]|nr:hypothetical protein [Phenylobacterium sp.]